MAARKDEAEVDTRVVGLEAPLHLGECVRQRRCREDEERLPLAAPAASGHGGRRRERQQSAGRKQASRPHTASTVVRG